MAKFEAYTSLDSVRISTTRLSRYLVAGPRFELVLHEYEAGTLQLDSVMILVVAEK